MIHIGVIGCGARSTSLLARLNDCEEVQITGVWDPVPSNARRLLTRCQQEQARIYDSFEQLVQDKQLDWIFVASPNAFHKEHIVAAFQAQKHVFSEKPLATSIADCVAINQAHENSGRLFATGFVLRYASIYRRAKEILASGRLGKIVSVNACENIPPEHGYYIMRGWRRFHELSGPHILEKCVHDLDLLNWFCESVPARIAAFGGNNMFVPENQALYEQNRECFEQNHFMPVDEPEPIPTDAFSADKTIEDNVVAIMEYRNSIRVQFQATMSNTLPERRMYFHCTGGNLIAELYSGQLSYRALGEDETRQVNHVGDGHGDGDFHIMQELLESMLHGKMPRCGGKEGLLSAVVGISIDQARREGRVLDIEPLWSSLGIYQ